MMMRPNFVNSRLRKLLAFPLLIAGVLVLLAASSAPVATKPTKSKGFFWKVTSPTTEMYLLGSIHLASPDMYPLSPDVEQAFTNSSTLVVEADVTKINQLQLAAQLMSQGMYPAGDSLDKHVSPEVYKQVSEFWKTTSLPMETIKSMKPFMVGTMMTAQAALQMGMDPDLGIDVHFLNAAKDKKIVELESADEQIKILTGFSDKQQEAALASEAKEVLHLKEELQKLVATWKSGNVDEMQKLVMEDYGQDADSKAVMDALIFDRNDKMTKKLTDLLAGKERVFVVVGAAHLIGDRGILAQLEKQHFTVERPELAVPSPATSPKAASPAH